MIGGHELAAACLSVIDQPAPVIVDSAAAAGFDAVTLRIIDKGPGDGNPLVGDTAVRRETLARLQHHGLGVLDVEVVRMRSDTDPAALRPMLESAAVLGAQHVLLVNLIDDEAQATAKFAEICEEAAVFSLRPALEFMVYSPTKVVEQADRLVAAAGHPAGAVLVDALHLRRSGGSPADVAPLAAAHPERYPYIQLCDAPLEPPPGDQSAWFREAVENRLAPGDGELPLRELLNGLPAGIPLSVETPVAATVGQPPAERLRFMFDATQRLLESP
jgi:sugar phosphate isomerase/epimerase